MKTKRLQRWWEASCKRLLWGLIPLLALSGNLQAQENSDTGEDTPKTPIPMFVEGHEWKVLDTSIELYGGGANLPGNQRFHYNTFTLKLGKQEEIDGKKYYPVYADYTLPGKEQLELQLFYYAREEANKIYFRYDKDDDEKEVFDYVMAIGDQIRLYQYNQRRPNPYRSTLHPIGGNGVFNASQYDFQEYRLISVDTLFIAGKERRFYNFKAEKRPLISFSEYCDDMPLSTYSTRLRDSSPYPWSGSDLRNFYWIEGIGGRTNTLFVHIVLGAGPGDQTYCFTDKEGVEHDIAGQGCNVHYAHPPKSNQEVEQGVPAKVSLKDGKLVVESADGGQHKIALFALDGTPLLQETSFTGSFETQLTHHESAQPMLLLFDGKASIRLYNSPK